VGVTPELQVSVDGTHWSPVPTAITPQAIDALRNDGTNYIGAGCGVSSSGNILVYFGKYSTGTSTAWSGTWYWRVAVGLPNQATGFGKATATQSGLVSGGTVPGSTSGAATATSYVGEIVGTQRSGTNGSSYSTRSTTSVPATTAASVISVSLNKGVYLVSYKIRCASNTTSNLDRHCTSVVLR